MAAHEAANLCVAVAVVIGPHNGRTETVGLGHNRVVRHDEPLSIDSHTIVPILGVPVDILNTEAVGERTAIGNVLPRIPLAEFGYNATRGQTRGVALLRLFCIPGKAEN